MKPGPERQETNLLTEPRACFVRDRIGFSKASVAAAMHLALRLSTLLYHLSDLAVVSP